MDSFNHTCLSPPLCQRSPSHQQSWENRVQGTLNLFSSKLSSIPLGAGLNCCESRKHSVPLQPMAKPNTFQLARSTNNNNNPQLCHCWNFIRGNSVSSKNKALKLFCNRVKSNDKILQSPHSTAKHKIKNKT